MPQTVILVGMRHASKEALTSFYHRIQSSARFALHPFPYISPNGHNSPNFTLSLNLHRDSDTRRPQDAGAQETQRDVLSPFDVLRLTELKIRATLENYNLKLGGDIYAEQTRRKW